MKKFFTFCLLLFLTISANSQNEMYLENDILSLEVAYKYSMYAEKIDMSFPNKMLLNNSVNPFRNMFRIYVPLNVRRKLKKILHMK